MIRTSGDKDDGDNESVDTQDTSHDNWDDRFDDEVWLQHSHAGNSYTTLGSAVSSSEV